MGKTLLWISGIANVVVIIGIAYLYFGGLQGLLVKSYIQPAYQRAISQFELLPVAAGDTVFLGDSITEGGAWEEWFPNIPVRNRGIGGDITFGVLSRLKQVTAGQPDRVFLLIGTNDLKQGIAIPEIIANIVRIVESIQAQSPGTRLYVQSILPRGAEFRSQVEALNAGLQQAVSGKAQWLNLYPLFLDPRDGSIKNAYSNDELHLTGEGFKRWTAAIAPYLK